MAATIEPLSDRFLGQAISTWVSEFHERASAGIQDEDFQLLTEGPLRERLLAQKPLSGLAAIVDGQIEGLAVFDASSHESRIARSAQVLYIRYLATAPWNRTHGDRVARRRRIGRFLITRTVRESIWRGCPGRVGVHALPGSESFFEALAFERVGAGPTDDATPYFELRPLAAVELLMRQESAIARLLISGGMTHSDLAVR